VSSETFLQRSRMTFPAPIALNWILLRSMTSHPTSLPACWAAYVIGSGERSSPFLHDKNTSTLSHQLPLSPDLADPLLSTLQCPVRPSLHPPPPNTNTHGSATVYAPFLTSVTSRYQATPLVSKWFECVHKAYPPQRALLLIERPVAATYIAWFTRLAPTLPLCIDPHLQGAFLSRLLTATSISAPHLRQATT